MTKKEASTGAKKTSGDFGEQLVARLIDCPRCKRSKTLKRLRANFKCADLICDFCGYLAQVKTTAAPSVDRLPATILGAAWGPQKLRMDAGIYFPLFLVVRTPNGHSIYYLPADLQSPAMFSPRNPLSDNAKKKGWQGFRYILEACRHALIRIK